MQVYSWIDPFIFISHNLHIDYDVCVILVPKFIFYQVDFTNKYFLVESKVEIHLNVIFGMFLVFF